MTGNYYFCWSMTRSSSLSSPSRILILDDSTLALALDEGATIASAALATERETASSGGGARRVGSTGGQDGEEEDGREEETGHSAPDETKGFGPQLRFSTGVPESIPTHDIGGADGNISFIVRS